ncbi:precorrin-6y C5,15-methyltransferase (decarboxylating) subunit CbiE [Hippea maritima]|uniref:Precorrin-6y C5,15-methyltransferase (Decarboxylating), CbiE subunit n=1 Tax=Hippea maritima (strain ATCC 700847 / DSM 10411 / MH2) TaxID=760142 RepID=F2LU88_HIPMA|nr:precorrin-6y C5,15-methyltransferase (decarboxylating) subunit CbiE [Hippea maritima]AEA34551.1 precorrin-6y C5,15-methyltransferase (decarboxylating), CbiE subunit [Hippea maritima DSM 10411]
MEGHKFIYVISVGCGSKEYLTIKAEKTVKNMDILIGHSRFGNLFDVPFIGLKNLSTDLDEVIKRYWGKKIGILVSGDAGFFSLAKTVYKRYKPYIKEVIPGISSFQLLFAKLKRGYEDVEFLSAHSKSSLKTDNLPNKSFILLCGKNGLPETIKASEVFKNFDIFAGCNLSLKDEGIFKIETEEDLDKLKQCKLCILFFERKA